MARKLRPALDLVSDIGSLAFDLQHHSEVEIAKAVALLRTVNAPMFDWLVRALTPRSPVAREPLPLDLGQTGSDGDRPKDDRS